MDIRNFFSKGNKPNTSTSEGHPSISEGHPSTSDDCLPQAKRSRTFLEEKRQFHKEWEEMYLVVFNENSEKPAGICVVCSAEIKQIKSYAMQRHYKTHDEEVKKKWCTPDLRKKLLNDFKIDFACRKRKLAAFLTTADQLYLGSLKVSYMIGKHRKPFTEGEFLKSVVMAVEPENKVFRNMALSNDTIQRRMDELGIYISKEVSISLSKSPFFSLCLDESNDITKTNQMLICVRYYDVDRKDFVEKFLCLTSIKERANAVNIHKAIKDSLNKLNVSLNNLCAATADGAAVMKSERNGVLSLLNKDCEGEIFRLHCIVHQEVLVSKTIIKHFDDVELLVRKVINVINTSSVLSNSFGSLCEINDEKHNVLLNYNHVRWLSFDQSVTRLCELYDEVLHALTKKHNDLVEALRNDNVRCSILFLKDFLPRLSSINKQLQNRSLTVVDAMFLIDKLKNTAKDLASQVINNDLSNFPSLDSYLREISDDAVETNIQTKIRESLDTMITELHERFEELEFFKAMSFVSFPFQEMKANDFKLMQMRLSSFPGVSSINWPNVKFSMLELRNDEKLKRFFEEKTTTIEKFWCKLHNLDPFKEIATVAILLLSIFPTTVYCERSFSVLHFIKNKYRNKLTDMNLEAALRLALEERTVQEFPFSKLLSEK